MTHPWSLAPWCLAACVGSTTTPTHLDSGLLATVSTGGKVHVNEVMSKNDVVFPEHDFPDWVELWNDGQVEVDLTGWWLSDDTTRPNQWRFPDGTTIAPRGFLVVFLDDEEDDPDDLHASFTLQQEQDEDIALFGRNVDLNPMIDAKEDLAESSGYASVARRPDGGDWDEGGDPTPTPGASNED